MGIVFDPPGATFRDKLFEKYKAKRQPMPDEMRVQLPFVGRLWEARRLPVLEVKGYEADDVIGTMAVKAGKHNLEVLIVSNDKDMMQLVSKSVRTLRTGSGGLKGDIIVDEKTVEELLGVPPEKVVDYMALHGDTIDNIPGAKGIGEKGAAELIKKYGSVESALDHADEVPNKRYREALQQQREQVLMSKQLAEIAKDAPIEVNLQELELRPPNGAALAELYRELGFSSLLKDLGAEAVPPSAPADSDPPVKADHAQFAGVAEFREYLAKLPAKQPLAGWLDQAACKHEVGGRPRGPRGLFQTAGPAAPRTSPRAKARRGLRENRPAACAGDCGHGKSRDSRRPQRTRENVAVDGEGSSATRKGDLEAGGLGGQRQLADANP